MNKVDWLFITDEAINSGLVSRYICMYVCMYVYYAVGEECYSTPTFYY